MSSSLLKLQFIARAWRTHERLFIESRFVVRNERQETSKTILITVDKPLSASLTPISPPPPSPPCLSTTLAYIHSRTPSRRAPLSLPITRPRKMRPVFCQSRLTFRLFHPSTRACFEDCSYTCLPPPCAERKVSALTHCAQKQTHPSLESGVDDAFASIPFGNRGD